MWHFPPNITAFHKDEHFQVLEAESLSEWQESMLFVSGSKTGLFLVTRKTSRLTASLFNQEMKNHLYVAS